MDGEVKKKVGQEQNAKDRESDNSRKRGGNEYKLKDIFLNVAIVIYSCWTF